MKLLRTASGFRLLFFATLGSSLGTLLATVALVIDVKDRTNSGPWVAALMFVEFLPAVAVGLFFGPFLDRLPRRGVMIVADLIRCAVFCTLPFATTAGQIVALAAIAGFTTGFFRPAVYAGLPNLVAESELARANSLIQTGENISWTLAPVLGGAIVAASSPDTAYWIDAASFLLSALLLSRIPPAKLQGALAVSHGFLRDLAEGFGRVWRTPALRTVLIRSEEHTSELQSHVNLVCRLLLEKKKKIKKNNICNLKKNHINDRKHVTLNHAVVQCLQAYLTHTHTPHFDTYLNSRRSIYLRYVL